jgi:LPXTG-site transpeptidase (sortase) family protein
MQKSLLVIFLPLCLVWLLGASPQKSPSTQTSTPLPPEAGSPEVLLPVVATTNSVKTLSKPSLEDMLPAQLSISSIGLTSPIVPVGVNAKGEMDVPSGKTNQVGWYKSGTTPGYVGSAVLDAHVFAAFKNLDQVQTGDDVYVTTQGGQQLHFKVYETKTDSIADVPLDRLFNAADGEYLNLITCAGAWSPELDTYTERFVVYAKLVE